MTSLDVLEQTDERVVLEPQTSDDPDNSAHMVMDTDRERDDPQAYMMEARVFGFPVEAICGYVFIPKQRATNLPVCSKCKDIYDADPMGHGDRDRLPDE